MPKRTTISFTVSSGKDVFTVPDLTNYTQYDVENYAKTVGLTLIINTAYSSHVPSGLVMAQSPLPNTSVTSGNTLTITISQGPALRVVPKSSSNTTSINSNRTTSANSTISNRSSTVNATISK